MREPTTARSIHSWRRTTIPDCRRSSSTSPCPTSFSTVTGSTSSIVSGRLAGGVGAYLVMARALWLLAARSSAPASPTLARRHHRRQLATRLGEMCGSTSVPAPRAHASRRGRAATPGHRARSRDPSPPTSGGSPANREPARRSAPGPCRCTRVREPARRREKLRDLDGTRARRPPTSSSCSSELGEASRRRKAPRGDLGVDPEHLEGTRVELESHTAELASAGEELDMWRERRLRSNAGAGAAATLGAATAGSLTHGSRSAALPRVASKIAARARSSAYRRRWALAGEAAGELTWVFDSEPPRHRWSRCACPRGRPRGGPVVRPPDPGRAAGVGLAPDGGESGGFRRTESDREPRRLVRGAGRSARRPADPPGELPAGGRRRAPGRGGARERAAPGTAPEPRPGGGCGVPRLARSPSSPPLVDLRCGRRLGDAVRDDS